MGSTRLSQNRGTVVGSCEEANKTLGSKISENILTSSESISLPRRIMLRTVSGCHVYSAKSKCKSVCYLKLYSCSVFQHDEYLTKSKG
jgi:hypothetical protein